MEVHITNLGGGGSNGGSAGSGAPPRSKNPALLLSPVPQNHHWYAGMRPLEGDGGRTRPRPGQEENRACVQIFVSDFAAQRRQKQPRTL